MPAEATAETRPSPRGLAKPRASSPPILRPGARCSGTRSARAARGRNTSTATASIRARSQSHRLVGDLGRATLLDEIVGRLHRSRLEHVTAVAHADGGRDTVPLEQIVARLQVGPEAVPAIAFAEIQSALGHAEGEDMHGEAGLASFERRRHHAPNLIDGGIGDRKTADRSAAAMHHDERAGAPVRLIEDVGEAKTERAVHPAVRIELLGVNGIEALGRLAVAFAEFRAEPPGPNADGIGRETLETAVLLDPKLELGFELEDADIDRHAAFDAVGGKPLLEAGKVGSAGQAFSRLEQSPVLGAGPIDACAVDLLASRGRQQIVTQAGDGDDENDA